MARALAAMCLVIAPWLLTVQSAAAQTTQPMPQTAPTSPVATAAATHPTSTTAAASQPVPPLTGVRERLAAINDALELPPQEADAYAVAIDRKTQLNDLALTMLMRRIATLPTLLAQDLKSLDQPSIASLLSSPQRYYGRPVRMRVYVLRVIKLTPGDDFAPTRYWGRDDGIIWRWDCVNADAERPADEPMMILTAIEPNTVLGVPNKVDDRGHRIYSPAKPLDIAGVFYKLYTTTNEVDTLQDYPVLLAWQVVGGRGSSGGPEPFISQTDAVVIAIGIIAIFVVFAAFKRVREKHATASSPLSRSVRPEDFQVDESLKAAAEQYRKDKAIHGPDHPT